MREAAREAPRRVAEGHRARSVSPLRFSLLSYVLDPSAPGG